MNTTLLQATPQFLDIQKLINSLVIVDDGELEVEGLLKCTFKNKLLIEVDADEAPLEFSIDAVKAAVLGFDLDEFPSNKRYVPYEINESLVITSNDKLEL